MAEKIKIKRYDVLEQQVGEESINYKAWDPLTQKRVTIKEPLPELLGRGSFLESFLNEANRLRAIDDEHVAKLYEVIPPTEVGGKCYLVTEYTGKSVEDLIHHGLVDPTVAEEIFKDALSGLKAIHEAGLVHANIRPSSILVTAEGRAKIADLRIMPLKELDGTISVSSEKYLPHEILGGDGQIGHWSDLYSLGCVAYEMLAGSYQFESQFSATGSKDSRYRDWQCDLSARAKPLKEVDYKIPDKLSAFVSRLMEKAIDRRFRNADHALRNLGVGGVPGEAPEEVAEEKKAGPSPEVVGGAGGEMKTQALFQVALGPAEKAATPSPAASEERARKVVTPAKGTLPRGKAAKGARIGGFWQDFLIVLGVVVVGIILVLLILKFL